MIFPKDVTQEQFARIRPLADKLEELFEEAHMLREEVVAAIGVALGEQYVEPSRMGLGILSVQTWALFAFEHGQPVKEDVQ